MLYLYTALYIVVLQWISNCDHNINTKNDNI
jgi:hypothetical protein